MFSEYFGKCHEKDIQYLFCLLVVSYLLVSNEELQSLKKYCPWNETFFTNAVRSYQHLELILQFTLCPHLTEINLFRNNFQHGKMEKMHSLA